MGNNLSFLNVLANDEYTNSEYKYLQNEQNQKNKTRNINKTNTRFNSNNMGLSKYEYLNNNIGNNDESLYIPKIIIDLYQKLRTGKKINTKKLGHYFGSFESIWFIFLIISFFILVFCFL